MREVGLGRIHLNPHRETPGPLPLSQALASAGISGASCAEVSRPACSNSMHRDVHKLRVSEIRDPFHAP